MENDRRFPPLADRKSLTEKIYKCRRLVESMDREEAGNMAHSFHEMRGSFIKLMEEFFPRFSSPDTDEPQEIRDLLDEIGAELMHILYHIHDQKYYRHWFELFPPEAKQEGDE